MDSRNGIALTDEEFRSLSPIEFTLSVYESNLGGLAFERMIVSRFNLRRFPVPLPPMLQSSFGRGTGLVEPIVDAYRLDPLPNNKVRRIPTEIKKGFRWLRGKPYLTTSREQLNILKNGFRANGARFSSGRFYVFEKMRPFRREPNQRQKMRLYVINKELIRTLNAEYQSRLFLFPTAVRV